MCSIPSTPSVTSSPTSFTNAKRTKFFPPPSSRSGSKGLDLHQCNVNISNDREIKQLLREEKIVREATPGFCFFFSLDVVHQPGRRMTDKALGELNKLLL